MGGFAASCEFGFRICLLFGLIVAVYLLTVRQDQTSYPSQFPLRRNVCDGLIFLESKGEKKEMDLHVT